MVRAVRPAGGLMELVVRNLGAPDEERVFDKGRFAVVTADGVTVGRASYEPGWKWSVDVGPGLGKRSCDVAHVVLVLEGRAMVAMDDGRSVELGPGDLAVIPPGHDSWVVGDEPYVSLHLGGAETYAREEVAR